MGGPRSVKKIYSRRAARFGRERPPAVVVGSGSSAAGVAALPLRVVRVTILASCGVAVVVVWWQGSVCVGAGRTGTANTQNHGTDASLAMWNKHHTMDVRVGEGCRPRALFPIVCIARPPSTNLIRSTPPHNKTARRAMSTTTTEAGGASGASGKDLTRAVAFLTL